MLDCGVKDYKEFKGVGISLGYPACPHPGIDVPENWPDNANK
jgi:hypothetical protein